MTYGVLPIAYTEYPMRAAARATRASPSPPSPPTRSTPRKRPPPKIKLTVKELPAYFTAKAAKAPGAVQLLEQRPGNIERDVFSISAKWTRRSPRSAAVIEHTFHAAEVCQAQTEMHAALADYDALRDRLTVWCSTQVPYYVHLMLAQMPGAWTSRRCASSSRSSAAASAAASRRCSPS